MNVEINKYFYHVVMNSLSTRQVAYLGESIDRRFDLLKQSGFSSSIPIPRQTAAQTLIDYYNREEDIVQLFTFMLKNEGERFYNRTLSIWGRDEFIAILKKHKWIYDKEIGQFLIDPFYEREINLLKSIRLMDLRKKISLEKIIKEITEVSKTMSIRDLEWRVSLRMYDLEQKTGELIRKILGMLLARQNLQAFTSDLFVCLKELIINASKANYKLLYEKHVTTPLGITANGNYTEFLTRFRNEIDENGNAELIKLAKQDDKHISITFQSSIEALEIWVTNNQNISAIEKEQILKKIGVNRSDQYSFTNDDDDYAEGAGMGINLILRILKNYTRDANPLKVVFYPDTLKIGFSLMRKELEDKLPEKQK